MASEMRRMRGLRGTLGTQWSTILRSCLSKSVKRSDDIVKGCSRTSAYVPPLLQPLTFPSANLHTTFSRPSQTISSNP